MRLSKLLSVVTVLVLSLSVFSARAYAFTFAALADTKSDTKVMEGLSKKLQPLNPSFIIYPGDLESDGFTAAGMGAWKAAVNGGVNNGLFDITFPVRGNHDDHIAGAAGNWQNYFNFSSAMSRIGGTNYSALNDDLTYSFDKENSRFIGVDVVGSANLLSAAQLAWIEQRIQDAMTKNLTHVFVYWHGPVYCVDGHCNATTRTGDVPTQALEFIKLVNKYPIISALFHGHEHVFTYTNLDSTRIPTLTRSIPQFIVGDAGAYTGKNTPYPARYDYYMDVADNSGGFTLINVSGSTFKVDFYKGSGSSPAQSFTFTKGNEPAPVFTPVPVPSPSPSTSSQPSAIPSPTASLNPSPSPGTSATPTPKPSRLPRPSKTPKPSRSPHPNPANSGDANILEFTAVADTTISRDHSGKEAGHRKTLAVDHRPNQSILLKFEIKGLDGRTPKHAFLYLYATESSDKGGKFYLYKDKGWDENETSWDTAKGKVSALLGRIGKVKRGNWYAVDLASAIKGDGTYAFRVSSPSNDRARYASRESDNAPKLEIIVE